MATCVRWARELEVTSSIGTRVLVSMASVDYLTVPIYTLFKGSRQIVDRPISREITSYAYTIFACAIISIS